jgi:hypothetical protein
MSEKIVEKKDFSGKSVKVLDETYEPGNPAIDSDFRDKWRNKIRNRDQNMRFLQTSQRYWYSDDWYGSEKKK